jgi:hypothetical protein
MNLALEKTKRTLPVANRCPRCNARAVGGMLLCGCRDRVISVTKADYEKTVNKQRAMAGREPFTPAEIDAELDRQKRKLLPSPDATKEKEDYFIYDTRPYRMKTPPVLSRELTDAMKRERLDKSYRFVWGGVVLVRERENGPYEIARGDATAIADFNGVMMPKYLFARAKQARSYCYSDDLNRKIPVSRTDLVPPGRIAQVDYRYVDFGYLRWFLEMRAFARDLIDGRVYDPKEEVPESEWICIMRLDTKAGLYYEPGLEMMDVLRKREWENQNANLDDLAKEEAERMAKAGEERESAEEVADKNEFNLLYDDVMRRVEKQATHFT